MRSGDRRLELGWLFRTAFIITILLLTSACGSTLATQTQAPGGTTITPTPLPSAASPSPSAAAFAIDPNHGAPGSGLQVRGDLRWDHIPAELIQVIFHPAPSIDMPDGTTTSTHYRGAIWMSRWTVHPNNAGQFSLILKVPRVLQQLRTENLWLIQPGLHLITLNIGGKQIASARFTVVAPPPTSSAPPNPEVEYHDIWPINASTIWLTGERCQASLLPTPDTWGNQGTPSPDRCLGLLEWSHNAGRTWTKEPLPDPTLIPQTIRFVDASRGVLILTTTLYCAPGPCSSVIYRTIDGGHHWEIVYHTDLNAPRLIEHGHTVIAKSVALTTLVFTDANDGWAFGTGCSDTRGQHCQPVLLGTNDGGGNWHQIGLPEISCPCSDMAHPTADDGWIVADARRTSSVIIVTHDGGQTWQALPDPATNAYSWQVSLFFRSASEGWLLAGGEPGADQEGKVLFHTSDGGRTWTEIASAPFGDHSHGLPSSGYVGPIVFSTDQDGWIIAGRLGLLYSNDKGKNWNVAPGIGYQESLQVNRFSDSTHGWLLSSRQLWSTSDAGAHWTTLSLPNSNTP